MSDIDLHALDSYLQRENSDLCGIQKIVKFKDGQSNPTYLVDTHNRQYVLRRQPFGKLLKSAHAVDREFRVIQALQSCHFPVPKPLLLCTDNTILGSWFYIMSYVPGRVFWNPSLPDLSRVQRAAIYSQMNHTLATLHDVNIDAVGLTEFGKPGNYFARQIERWTQQYRASETTHIADMNKLIEWLPKNLPPDDGAISLIHGDFRLDNLLFDSNSSEVRAVLDWELSTLGHPFADLAYQCMQLRLPDDCVIAGLGNVDRAALNIPSEDEYVAAYCQQRGLKGIPHWHFYLIFGFFRFAAILQGVNKRALDGNASSEKALQYGALAPQLASMATALIVQT